MDDDRFIQRLQDLKKKKRKEGNQDFKPLQVILSFLKQGDELPIKVFRLEMKMQFLLLKETVAVATPDNIFS